MLKEIPDFAGYYADELGNIYTTLSKGCRNRYDLAKRTSPRKLKYRITSKGYARVYLRRESTNKREDIYVHRIIAELFVSNPDNCKTVNHKNSDRLDNRAINLEWMSLEDNIKHAMNYGKLGRNNLGQFIRKD